MAQTVSIQYLDDAGIQKRETLLFPNSFTLANLQAWLAATLPTINDVTAAQITAVNINLAYDFSGLGLRNSPVTGSRLSVGLRYGLRDSGGQAGSIFIPAVQNTWVAGGVANIGGSGDAPFDLTTVLVDPGVTDGATDVYPGSPAGLGWTDFRGAFLADRDYK